MSVEVLSLVSLGVSFFVLLGLSVPVAFSLGLSGFISILISGASPLVFIQRLYYAFDNYTLLAIFGFMAMGGIAGASGLTRDLVDVLTVFLKKLRGGLLLVEIFASAAFGLVSGSTVATVAAIDTILLPEMIRKGYPKGFVTAFCAATGNLGQMVPPALGAVLFGVIYQVSIGKLLMAYIGPAILAILAFILVGELSFIKGVEGFHGFVEEKVEEEALTFNSAEFRVKFLRCLVMMLTGMLCLIGIYAGWFTPTEGSAVACTLIAFFAVILYRLPLVKLANSIVASMKTTTTVMLIISSSFAFSYVLAFSGVTKNLEGFLLTASGGKIVPLLAMMLALQFILGMFFEGTVIIVLFGPIFKSVLNTVGYDLILWGAAAHIFTSAGSITPPVAVNLYVACGLVKAKMEETVPYLPRIILGLLIVTALIFAFPQIAMWLPEHFLSN